MPDRDRISEFTLPVGQVRLAARSVVPAGARGLVICAHERTQHHHGPRLQQLTGALNAAGMATLQLHLLSPDETGDGSRLPELGLLSRRLRAATHSVRPGFAWVGLLAGDVATAAALEVAAIQDAGIAVVAGFSGRPDLVPGLDAVTVPTLLVVGSGDPAAIRHNQHALSRLTCVRQMVIVPGAGHLLDESGTLATAAGHISTWLQTYGERSADQAEAEAGAAPVRGRARRPAPR